jgi:hypothetical protein
MNTEGFSDKGWETAEEEAVRETGETRDEYEVVWILDREGEDLGD